MSIEYAIILISWIITAILLIMFVPREKIRDAWVVLLFKQTITWFFGLCVVELGFIKYPIRLFPNASQTSFTFEFFVYPALCVLFNLRYPENKSLMRKVIHYIIYTSVITIVEVLIEINTALIEYTKWNWYLTWITLFITFLSSRIFYVWFLKGIQRKQVNGIN